MQQKYLKNTGLIALITILSMIPPLSTDLYMPALPEMTTYFQTSSTLMSLTMTIFFVFMAIGILFLGPMSDKYGRKPILITSISISLIFSAICAFAPTISLLIIFRALSAFGAGGMIAIATALIKDSFAGKEMSKVLSVTQAFGLLAPMMAPLLGALILKYADWEMTFIALAALTGISLIGACLLQETLPIEKRTQNSTLQSISGLGKIAANANFTSLLMVGALIAAPYMAYLAIASYIYIDGFGVSETTFSIYFALNSAAAILGPIMYMRFGAGSVKKIINVGIIVSVISALLIFTVGNAGPIIFFLSYVIYSIVATYFRPMISDLLLSATKTDVGAASSVMNFGFTVVGSIGMIVGSLGWSSYTGGLATTMFIFIALTVVVWFVLLKAKSIRFDWK
ncbi:MFS transporter [Bacillus sp. AGMB 02131]|uniref:MFS transporter n=1 Tax=Peribacillus faecalis TaxID=2772559 RepID=A0A927D193_9BACI|nr:MFS transporter [Peribacillus faecalis]MBD3109184.1 MFS transporter [Peribacillus faecalis]